MGITFELVVHTVHTNTTNKLYMYTVHVPVVFVENKRRKYSICVLCSCGFYLLVSDENNGKMLPKCELGLVYLAHFYVMSWEGPYAHQYRVLVIFILLAYFIFLLFLL